ncbi:MAG: lamin tail domain-containing protein, partial [Verrucomicrobiota bacterium]
MKTKPNTVASALQVVAVVLLNFLAPVGASATGNVVISQVYGGGGGSGYYKYDYVELFNRSGAAVALTGWSLQYASAAGNFTGGNQLYAIPSGTSIPPGGYLLVQCGSPGSGSGFPVTPDLVTTFLNIDPDSGKVALANVNTALGTVSSLPDNRIVDFVGFGAANLGEGNTTVNGGVPLNSMQASVRKMSGCQDTDDNKADFDVVTQPTPRNSNSTPNPCNSPLTITCPSNITVRATSPAGAVVTFTVTTSGGCPPISVVCSPPSGSTFPIGATTVNCTATNTCGQQANCSFQVTVLRQLKKHFFQQNRLPPVNGLYAPPEPGIVTFPGGILISNVAHRVFSAGAVPPPSLGGSVTNNCTSQWEMEISLNGGASWQSGVVSNAPTQISGVNNGLDSGDAVYWTELQQLNLSGGTLPAGVIIRESPTLASSGEMRIETIPGGYMIDSFFDVFLEVSTDFGSTYVPAST